MREHLFLKKDIFNEIKLENINFSYDDKEIFDGLDLKIEKADHRHCYSSVLGNLLY